VGRLTISPNYYTKNVRLSLESRPRFPPRVVESLAGPVGAIIKRASYTVDPVLFVTRVAVLHRWREKCDEPQSFNIKCCNAFKRAVWTRNLYAGQENIAKDLASPSQRRKGKKFSQDILQSCPASETIRYRFKDCSPISTELSLSNLSSLPKFRSVVLTTGFIVMCRRLCNALGPFSYKVSSVPSASRQSCPGDDGRLREYLTSHER
jgi:hypothetical protein